MNKITNKEKKEKTNPWLIRIKRQLLLLETQRNAVIEICPSHKGTIKTLTSTIKLLKDLIGVHK